MTITPDGERIVYWVLDDDGLNALYVRPVDQLEGALLGRMRQVSAPFVSPESAWVGFYDFLGSYLKCEQHGENGCD